MVPFHIYAMKDTTFVGMFISTYGTLEEMGKMTKRFYKSYNITEKAFCCTEVFDNHYKYFSIVDNHNAKRHALISLEQGGQQRLSLFVFLHTYRPRQKKLIVSWQVSTFKRKITMVCLIIA
jgi:hypothetical protein